VRGTCTPTGKALATTTETFVLKTRRMTRSPTRVEARKARMYVFDRISSAAIAANRTGDRAAMRRRQQLGWLCTLTSASAAALVVLALVVAPAAFASAVTLGQQPVSVTQTAGEVTVANGYVMAGFNLQHPGIDVLQGDLTGQGDYGENVLASASPGDPLDQGGIFLADAVSDGGTPYFASTGAPGPDLHVTVLQDTPNLAVVRIDGIVDDPTNPLVTSSWTLSLRAGERNIRLQTWTRALRTATVFGLRLVSWFQPTSVYGLFQRGVEQMINSPAPYFATTNPLQRVYALGGGGSFDLSPADPAHLHQSVLLSASGSPYSSGFEEVLAGTYPEEGQWSSTPWSSAVPTEVRVGQTWTTDDSIAVNDHDFPVGTLSTGPNLPLPDLESIYTAIYGSSVGVLDTFTYPGEAGVTVAAPTRSYAPGYNFFDPGVWNTIYALLDSGDPYLINQARTIVEKSGAAMLPSGQIPHNFEGTQPTYVALSGATQPGPNVFWIEAALGYANATGNLAWLRAHMPEIERALGWLTNMYDPSIQLLSVTGPLWIDVFVRNNYASDTNAYMVQVLREVANAEEVVGNSSAAAHDRFLAAQIIHGMNTHLWAGNHYITQLNPNGSTADFGDNDSNLLAVAFGITDPAQSKKVLAWVASGPCESSPSMPGWVSQVYYGPNATYGGNTGDSAVSIGRIAWADGMANYRAGNLAGYDAVIAPIRSDLLANTWMFERYTCSGQPTHNPYYSEYPEILTMMLHDDSYGIRIGLGQVELAPFGPSSYTYHVGDVAVSYSSSKVDISIPGTGTRQFVIHGMLPGGQYLVQSGNSAPERVAAASDGILRFTAAVGPGVVVQAGAATKTVSASGGSVTFTAVVKNAKTCGWSSSPKITGFTATVQCKTGTISRSAKLPANTATMAKSYTVTLTVRGNGIAVTRWKVNQAARHHRPLQPRPLPSFR
jgi:hypothetical protein